MLRNGNSTADIGLVVWISPGLLSGVDFIIAAIGSVVLMRMSPGGGVWPMVFPMLIAIGNGLPWRLMDALSVSVVPKERAGMAAGIFTTMRVAGEAIAIAGIGAALIGLTSARLIDATRTRLREAPPPSPVELE